MINQDEKKVSDRWNLFWARENHDTPLMSFTALKKNVMIKGAVLQECEKEQWLDPGHTVSNARIAMENTYFGGDAFPSLAPDIFPDIAAAIGGFDLRVTEDSSRLENQISDWAACPPFAFDKNSKWWKMLDSMTEYFVKDARGDYLVGMTNLYSASDTLASVRGTVDLCMDLFDCPEEISKRTDEIITVNKEIFTHLEGIIKRAQSETVNWMGLLHPSARFNSVGSDFSCLVSCEEYERYIAPGIQKEIDLADGSFYHLDGPDALRHLDRILKFKNLNGVQWVPGSFSLKSWLPVCQRIQQAGMNLQIECRADEIKILCEALSPEGLHLVFHAEDEDEARAAVRTVEEIYRAKR